MQNQLLASIADLIAQGNWQRGGDNKAKRPKQIPRPGVVDDSTKRLGTGARSTGEIDALLARIRERGD